MRTHKEDIFGSCDTLSLTMNSNECQSFHLSYMLHQRNVCCRMYSTLTPGVSAHLRRDLCSDAGEWHVYEGCRGSQQVHVEQLTQARKDKGRWAQRPGGKEAYLRRQLEKEGRNLCKLSSWVKHLPLRSCHLLERHMLQHIMPCDQRLYQ